MDPLEAISHPSKPAQTLLNLAEGWPERRLQPVVKPALPRLHKLDDRIDGEFIAHLVAAYEAGTPTTQLTKQFGIGKGSVLKILQEAGVLMRMQGLDEAGIQKAIRLYASRLSLKKVGERLGVDAETVRARLLERGVVMRDTQGR